MSTKLAVVLANLDVGTDHSGLGVLVGCRDGECAGGCGASLY